MDRLARLTTDGPVRTKQMNSGTLTIDWKSRTEVLVGREITLDYRPIEWNRVYEDLSATYRPFEVTEQTTIFSRQFLPALSSLDTLLVLFFLHGEPRKDIERALVLEHCHWIKSIPVLAYLQENKYVPEWDQELISVHLDTLYISRRDDLEMEDIVVPLLSLMEDGPDKSKLTFRQFVRAVETGQPQLLSALLKLYSITAEEIYPHLQVIVAEVGNDPLDTKANILKTILQEVDIPREQIYELLLILSRETIYILLFDVLFKHISLSKQERDALAVAPLKNWNYVMLGRLYPSKENQQMWSDFLLEAVESQDVSRVRAISTMIVTTTAALKRAIELGDVDIFSIVFREGEFRSKKLLEGTLLTLASRSTGAFAPTIPNTPVLSMKVQSEDIVAAEMATVIAAEIKVWGLGSRAIRLLIWLLGPLLDQRLGEALQASAAHKKLTKKECIELIEGGDTETVVLLQILFKKQTGLALLRWMLEARDREMLQAAHLFIHKGRTKETDVDTIRGFFLCLVNQELSPREHVALMKKEGVTSEAISVALVLYSAYESGQR